MSLPWLLSPGDRTSEWRLATRLESPPERVVFKAERGGRTFLVVFPLPRGQETLPEEAMAAVDQEARCLERLDTPRVARLVERGTWPGDTGAFPFLVKEYVKGIPLSKWSRERPQVVHVTRLFTRLMETMQGLYTVGLRYPGLRIEDIWVRADALEPVFISLSGARPEPARVGAQERVGDMKPLGRVLYEMLTGQKPQGDSDVAPHLLMRGIPRDLSDLAIQMMRVPEDPTLH